MEKKNLYLNPNQVRVWSKELPLFFKKTVWNPEYELETYGLEVARLSADYAVKKVIEYMEGEREGYRNIIATGINQETRVMARGKVSFINATAKILKKLIET